MREVQLYINGKKLDLFKDEEIVVNSTIQNFQDLSKVFTDFSQTFTVPTSKTNNAIFSHFYNNDVDGTFRANTRIEARLEINNVLFRKGKIQLEGSTLKENQSDSYKVTFYGDVVTLKDLFGEDKLRDLDYVGLNSVYNGAEVETSLKSTTSLDVMYPLISSSRVWTYGDATSTDISVAGNAINYNELFPALRDKKILQLIEAKYNVSFNGNFLSNPKLLNSYTWWKNRETTSTISEPLDLEFNAGGGTCNAALPTDTVGVNNIRTQYIDLSTLSTPVDWSSWYTNLDRHIVRFNIFNTTTSATWYIDIYKDGNFLNTVTGVNNGVHPVLVIDNTVGLDNTYTFKMRSAGALTFDFTIAYIFEAKYKRTNNQLGTVQYSCNHTTSTNVISIYKDFSSTAPDQKISDWFSGLLKQFNLTCYPLESSLTYQIETLEDWYRFGGVHNITEFVDVKDIKVDRAKLYNEINFKWESSKSFLNDAYAEFHNQNYGELSELFPDYDGGKYEVKLPFENLLFQKFTGVNVQVAYCLTKAPDYKPYIPKPVKLYLGNNQTGISYYLNNGTSNVEITNSMMFGAETEYNNGDYSINFGEELSTMSLEVLDKSLYNTYYKPYLLNLFNPKTRITTIECILPLGLLTKLSLDDAIIIRDKKYRINDMSTNLTNGKVKLVLINDWLKVKRIAISTTPIKGNGGNVVVPIKPPKGGWVHISNPVESKFITSVPVLPAADQPEANQIITVPSNGTGIDRQQTLTYTGYNQDGTVAWVEEVVIYQLGSLGFLLQENGDYIYLEDLTGRIML